MKDECFGGLGQAEHAMLELLPARKLERQIAPVPPDKADGEWNNHRLFRWLARCRRHSLDNLQPVRLRARVVSSRGDDLGRAGLRIPEHELREVASRNVREALHELLDGRG